jgi:hypothetical protein
MNALIDLSRRLVLLFLITIPVLLWNWYLSQPGRTPGHIWVDLLVSLACNFIGTLCLQIWMRRESRRSRFVASLIYAVLIEAALFFIWFAAAIANI